MSGRFHIETNFAAALTSHLSAMYGGRPEHTILLVMDTEFVGKAMMPCLG